MTLDLGGWERPEVLDLFSRRGRPTVAQVSGGRSSGMMAAIATASASPPDLFLFENTGREDLRTLDYLDELDRAIGGLMVWLEYRPPRRRGAPPRESETAVVTYRTADRSGGPFEAMLEALAAYRETKGLGPVAPWARSRLCTVYLKHRVGERHARSVFGDEVRYRAILGLRADEPDRVAGLARLRERYDPSAPLAEAGISKADVMEFWRAQPFDLDLPEEWGNCTACFLKDEGDLARVLEDRPRSDAAWWQRVEARFPDFGGRRFAGYDQLAREGPTRRAIEAAIRAGEGLPADDGSCGSPRRFHLVVKQEERRIRARAAFSCSCEGAEAMSDLDGDAEDELIARI